MMSTHKVAPYTNANKNDVNDADGIAEASGRPGMRFVGVKSVEQQHLQPRCGECVIYELCEWGEKRSFRDIDYPG